MSICLLIILSHTAYTQSSLAGLYTNKSFTEEEQWWYLKADSTFAYTRFDNSYLTAFGYGTWRQLPDSSIRCAFSPNITPFLNNAVISVSSSLVLPYDSVYVDGQIEMKNGYELGFFLILNNKKIVMTDNFGAFKIVVAREWEPTVLHIYHAGKKGSITVPLSDNVNKHTVNIRPAQEDSARCFPAYAADTLSKLIRGNNVSILHLAHSPSQKSQYYLRKKDDQLKMYVNRLKQTSVKQPLLIKELDELLLYLK